MHVAVGTRVASRPPQSGRVEAADRASNDADVSSTLPIIPYGGFSPIRLGGWHVGQHLPTHRPAQACSRHTPTDVWFVSAFRARRNDRSNPALCRDGRATVRRHGGGCRRTPQGSSLLSELCFPIPASATAYQVPRSPVRIRPIRSALESFYFQASNRSVALPVAGYDYNSDWTPLLAGLSPARMAASLAAPDPYMQLSRIRLLPRGCDGRIPNARVVIPRSRPLRYSPWHPTLFSVPLPGSFAYAAIGI